MQGYQERHLMFIIFRLVNVLSAYLRGAELMNWWKVSIRVFHAIWTQATCSEITLKNEHRRIVRHVQLLRHFR